MLLSEMRTVARTNLKSLPDGKRKIMAKPIGPFQRGDWVWRVYPSITGGKLRGRNQGPWLVLAKTGPVTYKVQSSAGPRPELVHVDKLLP